MRNLVLCGFMGSGKSAVGKLLAERLHMEFVDTDAAIEKQTNLSIPEIFAQRGEAAFRRYETELIEKLSNESGRVISLGGGLAANEANHPYLKRAGTVILLDCGIDETLLRISGDAGRPLAAGGREDIVRRYEQRAPIYRKAADLVIDSSGSVRQTLQKVLSALEESK